MHSALLRPSLRVHRRKPTFDIVASLAISLDQFPICLYAFVSTTIITIQLTQIKRCTEGTTMTEVSLILPNAVVAFEILNKHVDDSLRMLISKLSCHSQALLHPECDRNFHNACKVIRRDPICTNHTFSVQCMITMHDTFQTHLASVHKTDHSILF